VGNKILVRPLASASQSWSICPRPSSRGADALEDVPRNSVTPARRRDDFHQNECVLAFGDVSSGAFTKRMESAGELRWSGSKALHRRAQKPGGSRKSGGGCGVNLAAIALWSKLSTLRIPSSGMFLRLVVSDARRGPSICVLRIAVGNRSRGCICQTVWELQRFRSGSQATGTLGSAPFLTLDPTAEDFFSTGRS